MINSILDFIISVMNTTAKNSTNLSTEDILIISLLSSVCSILTGVCIAFCMYYTYKRLCNHNHHNDI
jgi:spore maturation protein SpmA